MPRLIRCPQCRSASSVPHNAVGRTVRCSACSAVFEIPAPRAGSTPAIQRILIEAALWLTNALPATMRTIWASTIVRGCRRHLKTSFRIVVRAVRQWSDNQNTSAGAALAFYAVFAIVPLFIVAIISCATIFGQERSTRQIERGVYRAIGPEIGEDAADLLEDLQERILKKIQGTFTANQLWTFQFWTLTGSIIVHIACVLALFLQARGSLCVIWKIQNTQATTFWLIFVDYLLAFTMLSFMVLVLFTSLIISSWVPEAAFLGGLFSFLLMALALAVSYRVMSADKIAWRNVSFRIPWGYVWYGSAVASLLFLVGRRLLQLYLVNLYVDNEFYEGGLLIVFLLWVYYSSQAYFFGAELIQARRTRSEWLNSEMIDGNGEGTRT